MLASSSLFITDSTSACPVARLPFKALLGRPSCHKRRWLCPHAQHVLAADRCAQATKLFFEDGSYRTVVIAPGMTAGELIASLLKRVEAGQGQQLALIIERGCDGRGLAPFLHLLVLKACILSDVARTCCCWV